VELLAVEHRGDLVLGDEHLLVRAQTLGELVERDPHLGADVGDEIGIEHERLARTAQRLEGADLDRRERRPIRPIRPVRCHHVAHRGDCTGAVWSRPVRQVPAPAAPGVAAAVVLNPARGISPHPVEPGNNDRIRHTSVSWR
jgi:hypothetical protein